MERCGVCLSSPCPFPATHASVSRQNIFSRTVVRCFVLAVVWGLFSTNLHAQANFVYTNNNNSFVQNTVSAFSVDSNGILAEISGSPFSTGGTGNGANGFIAANRITICNNFLYASNGLSGDVSGFSIDPSSGKLTTIPGSPFAAGGTTFFGISLAARAKCDFLFAANGDLSEIFVFQIDNNGALVPVQGSPFSVPSQPDGVRVSPDGKLLSASLTNLGSGEVAMFTIASTGALTSVPGSPFPISPAAQTPAGIEINCASDLLFVAEFSSTVDVFNIASDGTISLIPGSPFSSPSGNVVSALSPNGQFLFTSNLSSGVNSFQVTSDGAVTAVTGSPFAAGLGSSSGVAVNSAGTLLYVSDFDASLVSVMRLASNGTLTLAPGSPLTTGQPGGLFSLAAFPTKPCLSALQVAIDIKPGSFPNSINPKSRGKIPVAILSTSSFDAPNRVDTTSLTFGDTGDETSLAFCDSNSEDVNRDGLPDLVCHFNTQQTGFKGGDKQGTLKGKTLDGTHIVGTDSVNIVPK
jgi:6-phosphogluconolactonase (cycloisomerase 2 family)